MCTDSAEIESGSTPKSRNPRSPRQAGAALTMALALAVGAWGCGGSGDGEGARVGSLQIVSGDQQSAPSNSPLPQPLRVRVVGKDGAVAPGITVRFDTVEGRGAFANQFATSDSKGIAEARYNVGKLPVRNRMTATITGASVGFEARALNSKPPVPVQHVDQLPFPEDLAFDNNGNVLVSSQLSGSIVRAHPGPFKLSPEWVFDYLHRGKTNSGLTGIAFDRSGNLFACDNKTGSIVKFGSSEEPEIFLEGFQFEPFALPNSIAIHPKNDDIFFSDTGRNRIYRVSPEGKGLAVWTESIPQPNGLAFSAGGDVLFVASLSPGGAFAIPIAGDGSAGLATKLADVPTADGIALDADGNIYVVGTEISGIKNGVWLIPADGSAPFFYFQSQQPKVYSNVAFGRAGFNLSSLYLLSLNGTIDEVDVGVPGLELPGPLNRPAG